MKIFNTTSGVIIQHNEQNYGVNEDWDKFINDDNLRTKCETLIENGLDIVEEVGDILPPIRSQEIWASGVTYFNSKMARLEESLKAGGGTFYEKVYHADRPELFYKGNALRCVGQNGKVRIRRDSTWNVPEPEFTIMVTSNKKIIGYTIGNDMSSRSIEGENPLYLPQAKTYDGSASIGPCLYLDEDFPKPDTEISLEIRRGEQVVWSESTQFSQMKRSLIDLTDYLFRECSFPNGCLLMTGTGIIPASEFTLNSGDEIIIAIDKIGVLKNTVE
ncbi:fumarylacetoacetate hydrolase family protein [Aegicerativicinus sediminis]|uniref:fumarylacetoacetate hydrolase family protein n=1 Tax=Aegicerativicinus sediminis TaxID=2893202 RepID=UPI001E2F2A1B|nr:fumarylacetoacetate hydrolase family protein [Aegicerativicinus sediminis]